MKKILVLLFTCIFLMPLNISASEIQSSIKNELITVEDLKKFLDIEIYKYKLLVLEGGKIIVTFKDLKHKRTIFEHTIEITDDVEYTMILDFEKLDGLPGRALMKNNKQINYSLNWNYARVFSGTITNPLYDNPSVYAEINPFYYGQVLKGKTSMMKFFSWNQKTDKEELIAEIYLVYEAKE